MLSNQEASSLDLTPKGRETLDAFMQRYVKMLEVEETAVKRMK
ncbi:hypothetical protein [Alkalibacterium subtropicum]|nr:hypothetical protein [Alkalibacterium subtropicum]